MSKPILSFVVAGKPATAGSKRAFAYTPAGGGRPKALLIPDNARQVPYMSSVAAAASASMDYENWHTPFLGPMKLVVVITFLRPASHFGTGKNSGTLKMNAPDVPTGRPDSLKVCRAVEDAMSGVVYRDDSQIVEHAIRKIYGPRDSTQVTVYEL